jgi:hypothetical protein
VPFPFAVHSTVYSTPEGKDVNNAELCCITDGSVITPFKVKLNEVACIPPVQLMENAESVTIDFVSTGIVGGGDNVVISFGSDVLNP